MSTETPRRRRRLAAILMADVVGFSKMMARDEERTTDLILEFHERVKEGIERHGGRVVGTAGDSVFGDFDSIVEAMELAAEIQQSLHERNASVAAEDQIVARIGLHLGDVIVEEYTVFGDGVNIAARLEQLADPGGILVSEAVYQQVKGHSDLPFEDLGIQELKNIDQPVRAYRVGPDALGGDPIERIDPQTRRQLKALSARRDVRTNALRAALESVADDIRTEVAAARSGEESDDISISVIRPRRRSAIGAVLNPGTLVIATLGVLGVVARISEWSTNAVYPAVGVFLISVAIGRLLESIVGRTGLRALIRSVGVGAGAFFFGAAVARAGLWVMAAAMFGRAMQRLRGASPEDG